MARKPQAYRLARAIMSCFSARPTANGMPTLHPAIAPLPEDGIALAERINAVKGQIEAHLSKSKWIAPIGLIRKKGKLCPYDIALPDARIIYLNFNELIRQFWIVPETAMSVRYTWTRRYSWKLRTKAEVEQILWSRATAADDSIENELLRLRDIPDGEVLLSDVFAHWTPRVNIVSENADGAIERKMRYATMPILIRGSQLPQFKPLSDAPTHKSRLVRSDRHFIEEPLLSTLPVYRFREEFREQKRIKLATALLEKQSRLCIQPTQGFRSADGA
jgi:hypothetical protein